MSDAEPVVGEQTNPAEKAQNELNDRANAFIKAYGELVAEHKMDFATYPVFMPDGSGGFKVTIQNSPVDVSNAPVKSPFITEQK